MSRNAVPIVADLPVAQLLIIVMLAVARALYHECRAPRPGLHTRAGCEPWTGCPVADAGTEPGAGGADNTRACNGASGAGRARADSTIC